MATNFLNGVNLSGNKDALSRDYGSASAKQSPSKIPAEEKTTKKTTTKKTTTKKKKVSDEDKKKLKSMTTSKQDKVKILKKYGLENDANARKTYKLDRSLTNAEIRSLKSDNVSDANKAAILKKKGLYNNANVLNTYKIDQNAFGKPNDFVDPYGDKISNLSGQLENFYNSYDKYDSKYLPIIENLQKSLDNGTFYDPETDPRAVQYRNDYTRAGRTAMNDTMGNAAMRTGGLASSYAQAAAQRQYNDYMDNLAGKLMDLRDLAEQSVRNNMSNYWNLENDAYGKYKTDYANAYGNLTDALNNYRGLSDTERARYMQDVGNYENYRSYLENQRQFDEDLAYRYAALEANAKDAGVMTVGGGGGGNGGGGGGSSSNSSYNGDSVTGTPNTRGYSSKSNGGGTGNAGQISSTFTVTDNGGGGSGKGFRDIVDVYDEKGYKLR